jgi:hypothetical protein
MAPKVSEGTPQMLITSLVSQHLQVVSLLVVLKEVFERRNANLISKEMVLLQNHVLKITYFKVWS